MFFLSLTILFALLLTVGNITGNDRGNIRISQAGLVWFAAAVYAALVEVATFWYWLRDEGRASARLLRGRASYIELTVGTARTAGRSGLLKHRRGFSTPHLK
ncbi:hypothetical protein KCP78_24095 [Salmonella enterica subsp. enterica]|nr:hypothetical protein KCP78_24095 [Salmonella enterica subsp. enterica]